LLVETWVAVPLQRSAEIVVPAGWLEGVTNWLLEGAWASTVTSPQLGAGGAGARLHALLKSIDPQAHVTLGEGALEPFELQGTEEAPAELGALPEAWATGLVEGTAHARLRSEGLLATVTGRYASRSRAHVPALRLVVRGVREDLLPTGALDPKYHDDLGIALNRPGAPGDLRDLLALAGDAIGHRLAEGFADCVDEPCEVRTQVRLFERTDGLDEMLRGFPDGVRTHLSAVGQWCGSRMRMPVEVLRRHPDGSIELWRGETDEVSHAG
jgi:hypothetical protein